MHYGVIINQHMSITKEKGPEEMRAFDVFNCIKIMSKIRFDIERAVSDGTEIMPETELKVAKLGEMELDFPGVIDEAAASLLGK